MRKPNPNPMKAKVNREAQRLAIRFLHQLAAVLEMDTVRVRLEGADTPRPIVLIGEVCRPGTNTVRLIEGNPMTLTSFLTFNVPMAREKGGTYEDLWATLGRNTSSTLSRWDSEPLEVDSLDEAVHTWLKDARSGEEC
jgi:hypothetical protein